MGVGAGGTFDDVTEDHAGADFGLQAKLWVEPSDHSISIVLNYLDTPQVQFYFLLFRTCNPKNAPLMACRSSGAEDGVGRCSGSFHHPVNCTYS